MAALAAVTLPGIASLSGRTPWRDDRNTARPVERGVEDAAGARILLTPRQIVETRNSALWPTEMRSLLRVDHPLEYGAWLWNDRGVPAGKTTIRIDLGTQLLSVARGGHEIGTAVILYGASGHDTPVGRFPILAKSADYRSRTYDAPMPYALRLTADGVAIHGSDVRWGRATHGCVGLPLAFARKLFGHVARGDEVLIVRS